MELNPTVFDKITGFVGKHKMMLAAGGVGMAGAAFGAAKGADETKGQATSERASTIAHHAAAVGMVATGVGAAAYAGRGFLKNVGLPFAGTMAKNTAGWYAGGFSKAFSEKSFVKALGHTPVAMTLGGIAGGLIANRFGDGDAGSTATGVAIGAVAGPALLNVGAHMMRDWKSLGRIPGGKGAALVAGAIGIGVASRAYMHEPTYESESTAVSDNVGGYEGQSGLRERLAAMNGSGDIVLGLHNKRH